MPEVERGGRVRIALDDAPNDPDRWLDDQARFRLAHWQAGDGKQLSDRIKNARRGWTNLHRRFAALLKDGVEADVSPAEVEGLVLDVYRYLQLVRRIPHDEESFA